MNIETLFDNFEYSNFTLELIDKDIIVYKSEAHGIKPLVDLVDNKKDVSNLIVFDKVVGYAAASLYCILKPLKIYVDLISESAIELLTKKNIKFVYTFETDKILTLDGSHRCPMEKATDGIEDPYLAYAKIKETLFKLKKENNDES